MAWILTWMWASLAQAAVPDTVRPHAAPLDAPAQFAAWRAETGQAPADLACDPLWEGHALLCFQVRDRDGVRWVTADDLKRWKVDLAALRVEVALRARAHLADQPVRATIDGVAGEYWVAAEGDGWSAAGALHPDLLAEKLGGGPVVVALPTGDALLAWHPGDAELDKVMAVGVRKMFEQQDGGVTPMIHRWDGAAWVAFGQAVEEPAP